MLGRNSLACVPLKTGWLEGCGPGVNSPLPWRLTAQGTCWLSVFRQLDGKSFPEGMGLRIYEIPSTAGI